MNQRKVADEILTKEMPFDRVLRMIMPMIHRLALQAEGVCGLETEDIEQELSIQAYKSWEKWEPWRGTKFSSYVYNALEKKKNCLIRSAKAQKRNGGLHPLSLDDAAGFRHPDGRDFRLYDVVQDSNSRQDPEKQAQVHDILEAVEQVLASMQEKGRGAVRMLMEGYTQIEVSRSTGISQPLVSYYLRTFRTKMMSELGSWEE